MNREEVTAIGFEIVAYSGDARTKLLEAVKCAKAGDFEGSRALVVEAQECLNDAHNAQTSMLSAEAAGDHADLGLIMVHAQDHLMTTMLLRDIVESLVDIYR